MTKQEAKERIEKLKKEIEHHRYLYHVLDKQEISEEALDSLKHELYRLEQKFPSLITPDSPTQRVAGKPLAKFNKTRHKIKQWSLEDAFSEEEIREWDARLRRILAEKTGAREGGIQLNYCCELKIDGLHIILTYDKGVLVKGATRGDGKVGEDVTTNIKTIEAIPLKLTEALSIVVEGEVFMRKSVFQRLNQKRQKKGEPLLANPRNAAAGAIRQLDPRVTRERHLDFFAYDISWPDKEIPQSQCQELKKLMKLGFRVNRYFSLAKGIGEVVKIWKHWEAKKNSQDYWLDGIVAKVDQKEYRQLLGFTGKSPRWALALKYPGEEATTIIQDIKLSLGRTGKVTPVAVLRPVKLAGTTVSRASLHNIDEIKRLDVRKGDTVIIHKAGDIIPQIKKVLIRLRPATSKAFSLPHKCPVCGTALVRPKGEVNYYCLNPNCISLRRKKIHYFVSKQGFNIEGLGPKVVDQLLDKGLITGPADIFKLREGDLISLERFAEKSAKKTIEAIQHAKKIDFYHFLTALGVKNIGPETALLLERFLLKRYGHLKSLRKLLDVFMGLKRSEIEQIKGVGPKIAESLIAFFKDPGNIKMITELEKSGVEIKHTRQQEGGPLQGQSFLFTGTLEAFSRDKAKDMVIKLGGNVASSVSKNVDFLVVGKNPGSKYEKAKKLGVKIIEEEDFLRLIKNKK